MNTSDNDLRKKYQLEKAEEIISRIKNNYDIEWLKLMALSRYGLVNDDVRVHAWPALAGLKSGVHRNTLELEALEAHPQTRQVELDVQRMGTMIPQDMDTNEATLLVSETKRLVLSILHEHPDLHYYQGFHDICFVFLYVLGPDEAFAVLNHIVIEKFSMFMQKSMDCTSDLLKLVFDLLEHTSPKIWSRLQALNFEPFFALSWVLTWFTHVLSDGDDIHRLYDFFLAGDTHMLIYLSVAVIVCSTAELSSTSDDFGELHHALTHLPMKHDVEKLVACSLQVYQQFGPDKLQAHAEARRRGVGATEIISKNSPFFPTVPKDLFRFVNHYSFKVAVCSFVALGISIVWRRCF